MEFFMFCFLYVLLPASVLGYGAKRLREHWDDQSELYATLYLRWGEARKSRLEWREEHSILPTPFMDSEYERLWEIELGAQAHLNILFPNSIKTSYPEYKHERAIYDSLEEL